MSYQVRNAKRAQAHTADTPRWQIDRDTERGECFSNEVHSAAGGHRFSTVDALRAFCDVNSLQLEWAAQYGEPGYTTPAKGILFADWNDIPQKLQDRLETQGYELEWEDEWYVDSDNSPSKAYSTEPTHHGWESRVRATDKGYLTPDDDAQEWVDSSLNELGEPLPSWFEASELELRGFVMMDDNTDSDTTPAIIKEGYEVVLRRGKSSVFYEAWTRREAKRELFLDSARGQYIPRDFAQSIDRTAITGVDMADLDTLSNGPPGGLDSKTNCADHDDFTAECEACKESLPSELYWDIWQDVLDNAVITDAKRGIVFRLEQDGDCWLVEKAGEYCEHEDKYYVHKQGAAQS